MTTTLIPALSCVCEEPEGLVERFVYPLQLTPENLRTFWEKAKKFPQLFHHSEAVSNFDSFCNLLFDAGPNGLESRGLFWVVDDFVGVYYMTHIVPGVDAKVHYTFFDRRHRGRIELTREMIKYVFRKYNFRRLSVEIPLYMAQHRNDTLRINAFTFVQQLGFKREGRKRQAIWYNNSWFDLGLYGILKEEALNNGNEH